MLSDVGRFDLFFFFCVCGVSLWNRFRKKQVYQGALESSDWTVNSKLSKGVLLGTLSDRETLTFKV